ncbi:hypothetical protein DU002_12460 [Corallincola holothuriorum]|uniref:Uncharacterized protein n=1 Tax=Corallincola holothuriorum TaxID=2282215 RepID=A0A368NIE6_9GAMM|nr:hypothetical protein DU002_12460 [Corallincola holothuriorum]
MLIAQLYSNSVCVYMIKKHWNTVICDGSVPQGELSRMIDNSFSLVVATLPKKQQIGLLAD